MGSSRQGGRRVCFHPWPLMSRTRTTHAFRTADRLRFWLFAGAWLLSASCLLGCASIKCKSVWFDGGHHPFDSIHASLALAQDRHARGRNIDTADPLRSGLERFDQAETLSDWDSAECIDHFYASGLWSWYAVNVCEGHRDRAIALHNASLARLIYEGQARCQLVPSRGLRVRYAGQWRVVPMEFHGFDWCPEDFQEIKVVGHYANHALKRYHINEGLGVPVVVLRRTAASASQTTTRTKSVSKASTTPTTSTTDFLRETACFAATAILKPDGSALALYNPLRFQSAPIDEEPYALARDITADLAYSLHHYPQRSIEDFLRPNRSNDPSQLFFLEPYSTERIPVIFVHGLLSSPDAWANIINELRTHPDLVARYQFWTYKYSTGAPFIAAASDLRAQLDQVQSQHATPDLRSDDPLRRSIIIGHSMGGLVSRLLIASSGPHVWNTISKVPPDQIVANSQTRALLMQRFFFEPYPMISRAVFIATPHRGSSTAGGAIGKVASAMVWQNNQQFEQIVRDNPDALTDVVRDGIPTSIDMLNPKEPFLTTIAQLPLKPSVSKHTILGDAFGGLIHRPSDGVVSVESAKLAGVESERRVAASHNGLLRNDETVCELVAILRLHAQDSPRESTDSGITK